MYGRSVLLSSEYLAAWFRAFLFTEAVEAPIYRRLLRTTWQPAFAASALTHPFVWYVFPPLAEALDVGWWTMAVVAELFAWLAEAAFFAKITARPWKRALLVSALANGASVATGQLARALFGLP